MHYDDLYQSKKLSSQEAVTPIRDGSKLLVAMAAGAPPALMAAIAQRVASDDLKELVLYYKLAPPRLTDTLLADDVLPKLKANTFFVTGKEHVIIKKQQKTGKKLLSFVPVNFSQIPRLVAQMKPDTFIVQVSPMDGGGYFSLGTNNDYASTAARACGRLIVEVNQSMPRVFGRSQIHVSEVDVLVENTSDLEETPIVEPGPDDIQIGSLISPLVPDGATIQLGIGKVPSGVARSLMDHRDLGIHTELLSDAMIDMIEKGVVTGEHKQLHPGKHVFTVALGSRRLYDFMDDNSSMDSYPSSYVNGISTIAQLDNFISINTAIEVDLYGQVNAEFIGDHEYSGSGGQFDFVKGASLSRGGKSIIALHSTALKGTRSTIVPKVPMVTDDRMDVEHIVTENGVVNLRGLSTAERAHALISIAHPKFREELTVAARKVVLI